MVNELIPREISLAVGTSVVEVSPEVGQSVKRRVLILKNTSTAGQIITISYGKDAVAGVGVVLNPGDGQAEAEDAGFKVTQGRITAVASAVSGTLAIHERLY